MFLEVLNFLSIFVFAFYGAMQGLKSRFSSLGILGCGLLVAFGGGTIRELILGSLPTYLHDYTPLYFAGAGVALAMIIGRHYRHIHYTLKTADAIGMATFAFVGAARADQAGLGIVAMCLFAALTAAGGGILCDLLVGKKPTVFASDFYLGPILALAIGYFVMRDHMTVATMATLIATAASLRILLLKRKKIQRLARRLRDQLQFRQQVTE
jgi:uncharacterized membrane protein YeiH